MLPALSVCEVGTIVLMDSEAEPAFEGADVVFEEVRILVQVDGLEGEFSETFPSVCIGARVGGNAATAEFGACTILEARIVSIELRM